MTSERNTPISMMSDEKLSAGAGTAPLTDGRVPLEDALRAVDGLALDEMVSADIPLPQDGGRTLEEIISDVAEQDFAQYPPVSMTPERLKEMAEKRRNDRADETRTDREIPSGEIPSHENPDRQTPGRNLINCKPPDYGDPDRENTDCGTTGRNLINCKLLDYGDPDHENMDCGTTGRNLINCKPLDHGDPDRETLARIPKSKIISIAAILILAVCIPVLFNYFTTDVGANKNEPEEIKTEDGVMIEDGGYGASGEIYDIWTVDEWEQVYEVKKEYPQMLIPEYIPEGYTFKELKKEELETEATVYTYTFLNNREELIEIDCFFQKSGELSSDINDVSRSVKSSKGDVYIQEDNNKIATICMDGGIMIKIWSNFSDEEIIKIVDNLY